MTTLSVREPVVDAGGFSGGFGPGFEQSGVDEFGNPTHTWATSNWVIRGIAPGAMQEPYQANRDASDVAWTVYADSAPSEYAEVMVNDEWFSVEGRPSDWTRGSYGPGPGGFVIELRRVEG